MPWPLALSILWLVAAALVIARAIGQRRHVQPLRGGSIQDRASAPVVGVVVPARNEAHNIETCVHALLRQTYPADRLSLWIIDDSSTDTTPAILRKIAKSEPRVSLMGAPSLPDGWTGKSHACWRAARSIPCGAQWLCFIDADMRTEPALLASAVRSALCENLSLLSLAPRHELRSFAERLMIPCGLCFLAFRQDLRGARPEHQGDVVATGQFFLVRRDAYEDAGGHAAVASEICEDLAFARLLKRRGLRVAMKDAGALLSTRMYTGWRTLWPGFAKNLTELLGGPASALISALACVALAWGAVLLPAIDALECHAGDHAACLALAPAWLATAALTGFHVAVVLHLAIPFWYGLLWPVGYTIGAVMVLDSLRWRWRGRVSWKGRTYVVAGGESRSQ